MLYPRRPRPRPRPRQVKVFEKWVKLQGQGHEVKNKGLVIRNTHMIYQSPIAYHSNNTLKDKNVPLLF